MGQPTAMNSVTASSAAEAAKQKQQQRNARNGYRAKELAEIRNSLRPFEQADTVVAASSHPLSRSSLRQLNGEQLRQLNSEHQLRQLNGDVSRQLNGDQLRQFNGEQLRQLNSEQLRQLNSEQQRQLNGEQLRQLNNKDDQLRTVSSLSESSNNSDGSSAVPGVQTVQGVQDAMVQDTLNKLTLMGYDEASAIRAVSLGEGRLGNALDILHRQYEENINRHNCDNSLSHTDTSGLTAVVRRPSDSRDVHHNQNLSQLKRCDSPASAPALPPRSFPQTSSTAANSVENHHHHLPGRPTSSQQGTTGDHMPANRQYSPATEMPPPLPPPRGAHNPPPTPPRGTTPPPPLPPHNSSNLNGNNLQAMLKRMSPVPGRPPSTTGGSRPSSTTTVGGGVTRPPSSCNSARGTSPVARQQALLLPSSLEVQQQVAQQLQALSLYPGDLNGQVEPPPPYPMGSAALPSSAPPPSYSQTIAMRQSPTLSSTSSDYRRSPGLPYPLVQVGLCNGQTGSSPLPACPSPVSSILSGSSRSSSMQVWSARQAKTHSPIIMQSVKSTQVLKPVLQTACAPTSPSDGSPPGGLLSGLGCGVVPRGATTTSHPAVVTTNNHLVSTGGGVVVAGVATSVVPPPPPPSYAASIQQKQHCTVPAPQPPPSSSSSSSTTPQPPPISTTTGGPTLLSPSPVPSNCSSSSTTTSSLAVPNNNPPSYNASIQAKHAAAIQRAFSPAQLVAGGGGSDLPPPPPYPSTVVSGGRVTILDEAGAVSGNPGGLVTATPVMARASPVINTAKVVANNANLVRTIECKPPLHRKYSTGQYSSPHVSETSSTTSRSDSPVSAASSDPSPSSATTTTSNPNNNISSASPVSFMSSTSSVVNTPSSASEMSMSSSLATNSSSGNNNNNINNSNNNNNNTASLSSGMGSSSMSLSNETDGGGLLPPAQSQAGNGSGNMGPPPPPPPYKTTHHTSPIPERKTYSREKEESRMESKIKYCPPQAFKFFMEQHIENVIKSSDDRRKRRTQLEKEMMKIGLAEEGQETMRKMLSQKESNYLRVKRAKMDKMQFKRLKTIGIGAFGEVTLVRKLDSPQLYAMKTLKKTEVLKRNQVAHVKAERDILAEAENDWVVKLYYSFQDRESLYFIMEYIPGGDLMSLLIKFGIFQESLARFYISELVCAVDSVHKMGFIHRDIKPDNILIDANGHIKLTDFGLCTGFRWTHNSKYYQNNDVTGHSRQDSMDPGNLDLDSGRCSCPSITNGLKPLERRRKREHQRCLAHSLVGTPNYIAPEVLLRQGYTQLCDWWSVGVILYEMLVGQPPFLANSPAETQYKVINWEQYMSIPRSAGLAQEAKDLILRLCTSHDRRLGRNGSDEIKQMSFFRGIDFTSSLRSREAPYKPSILYDTDTSNFDPIDPDKLRTNDDGSSRDGRGDGDDDDENNRDYHGFYEFTFRRFFDDGGHPYTMPSSSSSVAAVAAAMANNVHSSSTAGLPPTTSAGQQQHIDDNENPSGPVYV